MLRVFVAGASGVIGVRLVPQLVVAGHEVAGMTRSPAKVELLRGLGAEPVVCDAFDAHALREAVGAFQPEAVVNELTDLPDQPAAANDANARMRREGTRNLLAAAKEAGASRFVAQYGRLYGPGTYYEDDKPEPPRVHVDEAARRTVPALDAASGIIDVTDD